MAQVKFTLSIPLPFNAVETWQSLTDWVDHGRWIPLTRVWITKRAAGVGLEFVARSGIGGLSINDRMRVIEHSPEDLRAVVQKIGTPLKGTAGFAISPTGESCRLEWFEDIQIAYVPKLLNGPLTFVTKIMFRAAISQLIRKGLNPKPRQREASSNYGKILQATPAYYNLQISIPPAEDLHAKPLKEFVREVLDAASQTLVTEVVVDYQTEQSEIQLKLQVRTADRQTAHDLLDVIKPLVQKEKLQSLGGQLISARSRFGTIEFAASAPARKE